MRQNSLLPLLESFDTKEKKRFHQFLISPYFNVDKRLIHLFTLLEEKVLHKHPFDKTLQTKIYQELFSDIDPIKDAITPKQKKLLGVRMSLLGKLAKRFLTVEALEKDSSCEVKLLNKKLIEKKQYDVLKQFNEEQLTKLAENPAKDIEYYTEAIQVEMGRMQYFFTRDVFLKEDNFLALIKNLDLYYLIWKIRLQITMKSVALHQETKQYNFTSFNTVAPLLALPTYAATPLVILYSTTLELMDSNEEKTYRRLLQLLDQYEAQLSKADLIGFYTVACNYCSQQSRKQDQIKYIEESLALYKIIEQKDILVEEGKNLQLTKLSNLVDLSCKVGDFKWATELVNKYYTFLPKDKQESTKHLLLGVIHFYQNHYEQVLDHLKEVAEIGLPYDIISRMLRVKSSYELDQEYSAYTMQVFLSAQSFIRNKKAIPKERKKSYENFIHLLSNLYKVRHQEGRMTVEKIKKKMDTMELISNKKWLLDKMAALEVDKH